MSIFRSSASQRDQILSALLDEELTDREAQRVNRALEQDDDLRRRHERLSLVKGALQGSGSTDLSATDLSAAADRVRMHVERTIRVRPLNPPWWRVNISLPVPVLSAAAVLIFVLAGALTFSTMQGNGPTDSVAGERPGLAGIGIADRHINVQVNVDADHTDRLLQWLNEQSSSQQITVQLPEQAQFQLRGDPILVRREPSGAAELEIVPLEDGEE